MFDIFLYHHRREAFKKLLRVVNFHEDKTKGEKIFIVNTYNKP